MKDNGKQHRRFIPYCLSAVLTACAVIAALCFYRAKAVTFPELPRDSFYGRKYAGSIVRSEPSVSPVVNTWYSITPVNGFSSDRTGWHGVFRKGTENKVIVYFFGGGVSINEETERRYAEFFNSSYGNQDYTATLGISSQDKENPFRDWTVIGIPYSTGDFHIGTGEYRWSDEDGRMNEICHYGYFNYDAVMDEAERFIGEPDTLLITGFSAGGFAAALLADDVMKRIPSASNVTVCCDSALLLYDGWQETASNLWKAPSHITERLHSQNIMLDALTALKKSRGDSVKILFDCSLRDSTLTVYQSYIDHGVFSVSESTEENGDIFMNNLKQMVHDLQESVPDCGIYIFENGTDSSTHNTRHMIINSADVYKPLCDDTSIMDWIESAVQGDVSSHGLDLLEPDGSAEEPAAQ